MKFLKDSMKNSLHYFNGNYGEVGTCEVTPSQRLLQSISQWSGSKGPELAKLIGIPISTYYKILDGTIRDPRMVTFNKILGCYSRYYLMQK